MSGPDAKALEPIRVIAAQCVLGLARSWDLPPVADRALSDGVYTDSLAELAAVAEPTLAELVPLVERTIVELGLPPPSRPDAAWYLATHYIGRVALGDEPPLVPLTLLIQLSYAIDDVLPNSSFMGDGFDLGRLIGIFWSYTEANENYYHPERRLITDEAERHALLDRHAREEGRSWLARRASPDHSGGNSPARG